jgi:hypothetical protein
MAERPIENQNWQARSINSFGPKFRIDINNPQMGVNGTDVYTIYGVTDNNHVNVQGLTEGGLYKLYNDGSIEIIAGQKSASTGVDIVIAGKNGDVCISAEKNGQVRIRASNVVIDADEDLVLNAGRDVRINSGGKVSIQSNEANCDALFGNLVKTNFVQSVFEGTQVGADFLAAALGF